MMTWKCNICNEYIECPVYTHVKDKHYHIINYYRNVGFGYYFDRIIKSIDEPLESFPSYITTRERRPKRVCINVYECENCSAKIGATVGNGIECPLCKTKLVESKYGKGEGERLIPKRKKKGNKPPNFKGNPALMIKIPNYNQ